MSQINHVAILRADCESTIRHIHRRLNRLGIRVVRSFDLRSACASAPDFTCPHHEAAPCDCQLVILLAYRGEGYPASIVVHSHDGQTEVDLVHSPEYPPSPTLTEYVHSALFSGVSAPVSVEEWAYAPGR